LNATNFGSYSEQGSHVGYNFNFATGYSDLEFRSFFTFDLSSITPNIPIFPIPTSTRRMHS
jgi:hypothetical protein